MRLAGCVIQNSDKQILLIHRNASNRKQWELPGGKIDDGETPEKTAARELKEELNVDVEIVKKLGEKEFEEDGFKMNYVWFEAKIINGELKILEDKFDRFAYFSWQDLRNMENQLSPNAINLVNNIKI